MGVNISVASPLPDDVTLENYNGSWRVIPGANILEKIFSIEIDETFSSSDILTLTSVGKPTDFADGLLTNSKNYYLKIKNASTCQLNSMGIFRNAARSFQSIYGSSVTPYIEVFSTMTPLKRGYSYNNELILKGANFTSDVYRANYEEDSLRFSFTAFRTSFSAVVEIYEMRVL